MRGPGNEHTYGDEELHTESDVLSEDEYEVIHTDEPLPVEVLQRVAERMREL